MTEPAKLSAFVVPELGKGRIDAQWARIADTRPSPRVRPNRTLPAVGMLVAACAMGVLWWPREPRSANEESSVWEGSVVSSDESPVDMRLVEGTHIRVDPHSEVKLLRSSAQTVQVRLGHGSARFHVTKKERRRFSVNLGKVEVVVTGTQFRVHRRGSANGERVRVEVDEGSVEVHRADGDVVALHAGEHWSALVAHDDLGVGSTDDQVERGEADGHAEAERDIENPVEEPDEPFGDMLEAESEAEIDEPEAEDEARSRRNEGRVRRRRARAEAANAGDLLDHANLARRAGRLGDAAELYADLVARYPRDRRASLAAFELGRLRMDSLRDVRGAVRALERALTLDGHGEFAEDALARLVLAQEARGDHAACSRARNRYLSRYPDGVHAQHVAERCAGF